MISYKKILHHVNNKDFKRVHQRRCDEQKSFYLEEKKNKIVEQRKLKEIKNLSAQFKSNWRKEMYPELPPQEPVKVVEERRIKVPDHLKYDWKKELNEGMTSSGVFLTNLPATGNTNLQTIDSGNEQSFNSEFTSGIDFESDGFNLEQSYIQFSGEPDLSNGRYVNTFQIDTSQYTTIILSAIAGNSINGGATPNVDLEVYWFSPDDGGLLGTILKNTSSLSQYSFTLPENARGKQIDIFFYESDTPEQSSQYIGQSLPSLHPAVWDDVQYGWIGYGTIAANINELLSIENPTTADFDYYGDDIWTLMQIKVYGSTESGFLWNGPGYPAPVSGLTRGTSLDDRIAIGQAIYNAYGYRGNKYPLTYGITNLNFQRRTPINVFVPLDSPEAVSFIRVGSDVKTGTPGERYRKVMYQLKSSKEYTTTKFGSNFPGSNSIGIVDIQASPIGKEKTYDTWGSAAEKNAQQAASTFNQSQQSIQSFDTSKMEKDYGKIALGDQDPYTGYGETRSQEIRANQKLLRQFEGGMYGNPSSPGVLKQIQNLRNSLKGV